MSIRIKEETTAVLADYSSVSIAFKVESRYVALPIEGASTGWKLIEEPVDPPWIKDYDEGEPPTRWLRWDTSNWRIFSAFEESRRIGGAVVAYDTPGTCYLEGRDDIAALWDLRVMPEQRRHGVGTMLFQRVVSYARGLGCVELKIETQDVNVAACRFYAKQGCRLTDVIPDAYPGWPGEIEFTWRIDI